MLLNGKLNRRKIIIERWASVGILEVKIYAAEAVPGKAMWLAHLRIRSA